MRPVVVRHTVVRHTVVRHTVVRHTVVVGTEIERKFLADRPPSHEVLGVGAHIRQGYLAEEGEVGVRLRLVAGRAILTVKAGSGLVRTEVEVDLPAADAEQLWQHTTGRRIDKSRHRVALETDGAGAPTETVAEVDVFHGGLAGLCMVEVEFSSVESAAGFVPPQWFGREVTGDAGWTNASLARSGRPH